MKYTFKEIAFNSTEKRIPVEEDRFTYIGLEHLDSRKLSITRFGSDVPLKGEKLVMRKGDILFGKRNTYLKRVAIAPFDGLFSAHGMVLRPNEKVISREFFPFFLSSDYFLDEAIRISVGSLSPTVNWKDLKDLEFEIPDFSKQREIANLLSAANNLKESYEAMIAATDEMVKSQFVEMFGNIPQDKKLAEISEIYDGVHQTPHYTDFGIKFISVEDISDIYGSKKYISIEDYNKYKHVPELGDLIMTRIGTIGLCAVVSKSEPLAYYVSVTLIKPNHNIIDSTYLKYYIESGYGQNELRMRSLLEAFPMKINLNEIGKVAVKVPSMESQHAFVQIVQRADKSKFELKQAIEKIDKVMRALMQ